MAIVCDLAIHEVGCRSLNEFISTIFGQQKLALLGIIASKAVFLSNDRFGNYVVQHAMLLGDKFVALYILRRLQGHFVQLSQVKGASNVVERCVESSRLGTCVVVTEILQTPSASYQLAQHPYGNYIIQVALKQLKKYQIETLYLHLVEALAPHFPRLQGNAGGRKILDLILSGFEIQHQGWPEF
ncbi:pumilio homolog 12-like [Henckelia pumila]|uniref:pumilio homolog 12-like n=1 Tax=Henckelia pumila TaxID=405737 RepID=UPI003C6E9258